MNISIIPASWQGPLQAALRVMAGLLVIEHATNKLLHFPASGSSPSDQPLPTLLLVAALIELVGGTLITLGLFTRLTAFVLAGHMAVIYFMAHITRSFFPLLNGGESAVLFCFIFLYLASVGAGPFSLDDTRKI